MNDASWVVDKRKGKKKQQNGTLFGFLNKIKRVKHLDIVVAVAVVGLALIFGLSAFGGNTSTTTSNTIEKVDYTSLENRVCEVLSQIKGAGNVKVMINFSDSGEIITATTSNSSTDKTTDTSASGDRTTESKTDSTSPVIIKQDGKDTPLIVKEIAPKVLGVVVVAEGAGNVGVRINLLQAVQTLLRVDADKVEIFTMK